MSGKHGEADSTATGNTTNIVTIIQLETWFPAKISRSQLQREGIKKKQRAGVC